MADNKIIYKLESSKSDSLEAKDIITGYELRINDKMPIFNIGHLLTINFDGVIRKFRIVDIEHIVKILKNKPKVPTSNECKLYNTTIVYLKEKKTTKDNMDFMLG